MVSITFIQHDPKQERRQKELDLARAKAHAARWSHDTKKVAGKSRRSVPPAKAATRHQQEEIDREGRDKIPLNKAFEGNSDPFHCFGLDVTPELNRILHFTRDVILQAHYAPFGVRTMSSRRAIQLEAYSVSRAWGDILASLEDEGTGLARLTTYCQYMSNCLPSPQDTQVLVRQMRRRSLQLLRDKLKKYTEAAPPSSPEERNSLKTHIFGMFDVECFCGDTDAAIVHGTALQKLTKESDSSIDLQMAQRLIYIICHTAASSGKRTLSHVSEWLTNLFEDLMRASFPPNPLGVFQVHVLHPCISAPQLQELFHRLWYLTDAVTQWPLPSPTSNAEEAESATTADRDAAGEASNGRELYAYLTLPALLCMTRLNDAYHDLVEGVWLADVGRFERLTQAALSAALNYLTRELFGDLTVDGVNVRDYSAVQMDQLKTTLRTAYRCSTDEDRVDFAPAYLWLFWVGALCEHRHVDELATPKIQPEDLWFSPLLGLQAQRMGVVTWPQMWLIARQFFYASLIDPDGEVWFETLMKRFTLPKGLLVPSLARRFPWFFRKSSSRRAALPSTGR